MKLISLARSSLLRRHICLLFGLLLAASLPTNAASNLLLTSERGELFMVWINGILQTQYSGTSFYIKNVPTPTLILKIDFLHKTDLEQSLYIAASTEYHYNLKSTKEGKVVLQYKKEQKINKYNRRESVRYQTLRYSPNSAFSDSTVIIPTSDQFLSQDRFGRTSPKSISHPTIAKDMPPVAHTVWLPQRVHNTCTDYMSDAEFEKLKGDLLKKRFEVQKINLIKETLTLQCLSFAQIVQLLPEFSFEANKTDLLKFAYHFVAEPDSGTVVLSSFELKSSIKEWKDYLAIFSNKK